MLWKLSTTSIRLLIVSELPDVLVHFGALVLSGFFHPWCDGVFYDCDIVHITKLVLTGATRWNHTLVFVVDSLRIEICEFIVSRRDIKTRLDGGLSLVVCGYAKLSF